VTLSPTATKTCVSCRFVCPLQTRGRTPVCAHPYMTSYPPDDLVHGLLGEQVGNEVYQPCNMAREGSCGAEARYYTPAAPGLLPSFLKWLKRAFGRVS